MERMLTCECGVKHIVSNSQAGQELPCECGRILKVPNLSGLRELPAADADAGAETASVQAKTAVWSGWRGPAIAVASTILLIGVIMASRFAVQRAFVEDIFLDYSVEQEVAENNELIQDLGADGASEVFYEFENASMGPKFPPPYVLWQRYAQERLILLGVWSGVAGVGAIAFMAVWLSARSARNSS